MLRREKHAQKKTYACDRLRPEVVQCTKNKAGWHGLVLQAVFACTVWSTRPCHPSFVPKKLATPRRTRPHSWLLRSLRLLLLLRIKLDMKAMQESVHNRREQQRNHG